MDVDARRRSQLYQRLAGALGEEAARTMFELLPQPGARLATGDDIRHLATRLDRVDGRLDGVDGRLDRFEDRMEAGFAALRGDIGAVRDELLGMRGELGGVRSEITSAVAGQTRALVLGVMTAVGGIAGLAYTFSQVF